MARARARRDQSHWVLSALLLVAIGIAAWGMSTVLSGVAWWFQFVAVTLVVLLAAAIVRSTARGWWWPSIAAVGTGVASLTVLFAPGSALLGLIPTLSTFGAFQELQIAGATSIAEQDLPADADQGISFLLCVGAVAIAITADAVTHVVRTPALAGVPLLVLVLVPSLVQPSLGSPLIFLGTAIAWLAIMLVASPARRFALGTAAAALAAALLLPVVLPSVEPADSAGAGSALSTGLNPIVTLGNDLRRADATLALTYRSTAGGQYLRLAALDNFTGVSWEPTATERIPGNDVDVIGPVPGLAEGIPSVSASTDITIAGVLSRWLPAPYAPNRVSGLDGDWWWEPTGLSIRTDSSNARNQQYRVDSVLAAPSVEQLVATGTTVEPGLDRYLVIPEDLPAVVGETARTVVGAASTNYDKAIALQSYFRDGTFVYSQDAPVEQNFDGSGAAVLGAFLATKSGYCVHFSSAMAAMARTLGIPARIAVGFTPGELSPGSTAAPDDAADQASGEDAPVVGAEYRVTTENLHAWPELYFAGIGWVRFEPTPGRGVEPAFAPLTQDDPATPDVDESVPPAPTPSPTAAPTTAPTIAPDDPETAAPDVALPDAAASPVSPWPAILVLLVALLATPAVARIIVGRRRLAAARAGSSTAAWAELAAVVADLGLPSGATRTPRQAADDLSVLVDPPTLDALNRLTAAVERDAFAGASVPVPMGDLAAVLTGVRRGSPWGARLMARVLPRSLVAGWLPRLAASEPVE